MEVLADRLENLTINEGQEEQEHEPNIRRNIKTVDIVYVVNWKDSCDKFAIVARVRLDPEFEIKVFIKFEGTQKTPEGHCTMQF